MSLLQFCKTERQREVISRGEEGISQRAIAKELGIAKSTIVSHLEAVKGHATRQGYSPEHDYTHPVPDGFTVKGVSTYYNDEGKPVGQWVKSLSDKERQLELLIERMENSLDSVKPFKPTKPPKVSDNHRSRISICLIFPSPRLQTKLLAALLSVPSTTTLLMFLKPNSHAKLFNPLLLTTASIIA